MRGAYAELEVKLRSLADVSLRVGVVREAFAAAGPAETAHCIIDARIAAGLGETSGQLVWCAVISALLDATEAERQTLAETARTLGLTAVEDLLIERTDVAPEANRPLMPKAVGGRPLTLGERKSLARKQDRRLIKRVVRDPSADVIDVLLSNPAVTEDDVVQLAAARPVDPEVIRKVAANPKWSVRYRVRNTIVRNPYGEARIAAMFVPLLRQPELLEASRAKDLSAAVRLSCRDMLELGQR